MEGNDKKQILLRLPKSLYDDLAKWADEDFRSVNGQLEYLIHESVSRHKKSAEIKNVSSESQTTTQSE